MKKVFYTLCFITPLLNFAQEGTSTSGGEASSTSGTVRYTVGQIATEAMGSENGSVSPGIQQSYEVEEVVLENKEAALTGISIFPNPTTDLITIASTQFDENTSIQLTDAKGLTLKTIGNTAAQQQFDMMSYPQGMYFITIYNKSEKTNAYKIIKN